MEYKNFDIFIEEKTQEGYLLKAQAGNSGEARSYFSLDLSDPGFKKTLALLHNHQVDKNAQIEFGEMLYSHLFKEDIERVFHEYNGDVFDNGNVGIRIRLRIYPPEIAYIPWELLYSPLNKQFLATSQSYPLVRYIELPQRIRELKAELPVNILVAIPEYPSSYYPLDASQEKTSLLEALEDIKDSVNIHFIEGKVTRTKISDLLLETPFHCFHFIGHGDFSNDKGTLLLNSDDGDIDPIDDVQFASLLQNHPSMKLVLLNSCKGAEVSTIQPMVGLAPRLVQNGIPAVVAMQYAIYDDAAVSFAREFYRQLFRGYDSGRVDMAISHARNILANNPATQNDMCTPVLFMRSATGTLFDLDTGWIIGVPFNKELFQAAQSASAQYSFNQSIEHHTEDSEGLKNLQQKIRYGRYAVISAIVAVIVMFSLLWVNAFDVLTLDIKSEALIMGIGNKLVPKPISNDLALIGFKVDREEDQWKEKWRKRHTALIGKLSTAGASVIVFDIKFVTKTTVDSGLISAINRAKREHKTTTIIGYENVKNNDFSKPIIDASILSSEAISGLVSAGKKMGLVRTIVLAAEKENNKSVNESKKLKTDYSVVLEAYSAFIQKEILKIDAENMQIVMEEENIDISEYKQVRENQKGVIQKGDYVAQNYFDYSPIQLLRGNEYSHPYEKVLNQYNQQELEQAFKGKIVLIGEQNSADLFSSLFGLDRYGYELLAEALNSLLQKRTIKPTHTWVALFLMVLSGALGAFLRYYVHFHHKTSRVILLTAISAIYLAVTIFVFTELLILINIIYQISTLFFSYWITGKLIQRRNV